MPARGGGSVSTNKDSIEVLGGGAINERKRRSTLQHTNQVKGTAFEGIHHRSHLWHALEGLDRYPNYLSRWNCDEEIDELELALESQLAKVREQRAALATRRTGIEVMMEAFKRTHPIHKEFLENSRPLSWDKLGEILDSQFVKAIVKSRTFRRSKNSTSSVPDINDILTSTRSQLIDLDAHLLEDLMEEEMFDVYSMPVLSREFCDALCSCLQAIATFASTVDEKTDNDFTALKVGQRAIDLDTIGLGWINNLLFNLVVRPLSYHLYKDIELSQGDLDWRQGYVAGYSATPSAATATPRQRLVSHTDDSEVTLNVCLHDDFEGGALQFRGLRGTEEAGRLLGTFQPEKGRALLHAGRHLHEVTEVTSGNRYTYILWARSWSATRRLTCPCCWMNRRQDETCICGSYWK